MSDAGGASMHDLLRSAPARAVFWVSVAIVFSLIGVYVIRKWRDHNNRTDLTVDHLANFHEMRATGLLTEGEYRTIRRFLGKRQMNEGTREDKDSSFQE